MCRGVAAMSKMRYQPFLVCGGKRAIGRDGLLVPGTLKLLVSAPCSEKAQDLKDQVWRSFQPLYPFVCLKNCIKMTNPSWRLESIGS
uniref:Uncharacterized protein n=1 Tax=Steinernema glaseri TaxID=37863 RepID=A0A1I7Y483_9BILA